MFLSRCILNSRKPVDYYQLHKDLWNFFSDYNKSSPYLSAPFFYRIENPHEKGEKIILMQSIIEPARCNTSSAEMYCRGKLQLQKTKAIGDFLNDLQPGQELRFLVRAYPSKRLKKEGKTSNRGNVRVPLRKDVKNNLSKEEVTRQWLKKIMEKENSLSIQHCQIIDSFPLRFRKKQDREYHYGTIYNVTYKGYLKIKEVTGFQKLMACGIGPAKAFGCGMLSIAKA